MDKQERRHALSIVIFKEEDHGFSAVCLEHFIGAQGASLEQVQNRLRCAYRSELERTRDTGQAFHGIPEAPGRYREMLEPKDPSIVAHGEIFEDLAIGQPNLALAA